MSRQNTPGKLTNSQIKSLLPKAKSYKIGDGGGLHLLVHPNGSKYWRLKYHYENQEKILSLGVYPGTKLKTARDKALEAKLLLSKGIDPAIQKRRDKLQRVTNSFKAIALEWWHKEEGLWTSDHASRVKQSLEKEAFPILGEMRIDQITAQDCLQVIREIESRDALDVASRVKQRMSAVFRYAIYTGYVTNNPVDALKDVIRSRKVKHQKALDLHLLPQFLSDLETNERITEITRYGLKVLIHTFVRPGELRAAKWSVVLLNIKHKYCRSRHALTCFFHFHGIVSVYVWHNLRFRVCKGFTRTGGHHLVGFRLEAVRRWNVFTVLFCCCCGWAVIVPVNFETCHSRIGGQYISLKLER